MSNLAIFGIITYFFILLTAISATLKIKGKKVFSFKTHKYLAWITIILALGHGIVGLARFF